MSRFRSMQSLQKFAAIQSSIHNHFNLERHFYRREEFKENRSLAQPNGVDSQPNVASNPGFRDRSAFI